MKKDIISSASMTFEVTLKLTETEARALEAIVGYGTKVFLEKFYEHLGKHYLQPYEKGVYSLFDTIAKELPDHLNKFDDCRSVYRGEKIAVIKETNQS